MPDLPGFSEEATRINLRRCWWLIVIGSLLNALFFVFNLLHPSMQIEKLATSQMLDFACSAVMLLVVWILERNPKAKIWRQTYVLLFAILLLGLMGNYYFSLLPILGETSTYTIGVVTLGVTLLLPPRVFLPLLLGNHLVFIVLLLMSERDGTKLSTSLLDGTAGISVACLAAWFLYSAKAADFRKGRIIAQRNRELEENHEEMNEIMAMAAHDLRSPIFGLKQWLETLPAETRMLRPAIATCVNMLSLIERLLTSQSLESQTTAMNLQVEDLRVHVSKAVERISPQSGSKLLSIRQVLPDQPAIASLDADVAAQIFDNILSNAVKFSPENSTITLELSQNDNFWHLDTSDNGPGIPKEFREKLFRKFQRGPIAPGGGEPGAGLGLFIVAKLMTSMGGSVVHVPRQPEGSTFSLRFPVHSLQRFSSF